MPFLQFKGRSAVETYHYSLPHHALEMEASRSVLAESETPSLEGNIIIEGDNLLALKALLPTHAGQIKCIYIDPPYNTGNEGWVYNDNLTQPQFREWIGQTVGREGEDAARHDKWCCMMLPRLLLLRELLHEAGAIIVSIGDEEIANLRGLMDEVFGAENYRNTITVRRFDKNLNNQFVEQGLSRLNIGVEYAVIYAASSKFDFYPVRREATEDRQTRGYWKGFWNSADRPTMRYDLLGVKPEIGQWKWKQSVAQEASDNYIHFLDHYSGNQTLEEYWLQTGKKKKFIRRNSSGGGASQGVDHWIPPSPGILRSSNWVDIIASESIEKMGLEFDNPKSAVFIQELIHLCCDDTDTVLDSFAGSGTTGQAVLELNREDGGNRKFILVQQPYEPRKFEGDQINLCDSMTAERIRRVIGGYAFTGNETETLFEEKVGLNTLKKADELLQRIEMAKEGGREQFDTVKAEMKDGVVRVIGSRNIEEKTEGIGGSFTYARVSDAPLLGDYAALGEKLPTYADLAKYLYYTETSRNWNPADVNEETGRIGEWSGTSYYLLYRPNWAEDWGLSLDFLRETAVHDPNTRLVIYHEKLVMSRDQIRLWETDNGKRIRSMIVPFQLR